MDYHKSWVEVRNMRTLPVKTIDSISSKLTKCDLRIDGNKLKRKDKQRLANAFSLLICTLIPDICWELRFDYPDLGHIATAHNLSVIFEDIVSTHNNCEVVFNNMKAALLVLRHLPEEVSRDISQKSTAPKRAYRKLRNIYGFKVTSHLDKFIGMMLQNVAFHIDDVRLFQLCNTVVQFMSRLTLTQVPNLEEKMISDYIQFEKHLADDRARIENDSEAQHLLDVMAEIVSEWFFDFKIIDIEGQHGYGATNGVHKGVGTAAKYYDMNLDRDTILAARLLRWKPATYVWPGMHEQMLKRPISLKNRTKYSQVQLVPKGIDKKRVISMEDTTNQYFQKNLFKLFDNHFKKHPEIFVDLHNQKLSQDMCMESSYSCRYGTADLSSASDSVTWYIVERVFSKCPEILGLLMHLTRTQFVRLPGAEQLMSIEKAYPMGSAMCFPVECVVFSAVLAASNRIKGLHTKYRVYGDDMIIHWAIWPTALKNLQLLGFIVNPDKSYAPASKFKEACGCEALDGSDVSPIRLSRGWDVTELCFIKDKRSRFCNTCQSTMIDGLTDLANVSAGAGFPALRRWCLSKLKQYFGQRLFSRNKAYCLYSGSENQLNQNVRFSRDCTHFIKKDGEECIAWGEWKAPERELVSRTNKGPDHLRYSKMLDHLQVDNGVEYYSIPDSKVGKAEEHIELCFVPCYMLEYTDQELAYILDNPIQKLGPDDLYARFVYNHLGLHQH